VFSEYTVSVKTDELKNLTQHCTIVNVNKDNIYYILDIYNKAKKDNLFATERTTQWLKHKFLVNESYISPQAPAYPIGTIDMKNTWIALEGNTPIGYVIVQHIDDILFVEEFLTLNDKATASLLSTLKNIAEHGNSKVISIHHCTPNHPLHNYMTQFNSVFNQTYPKHKMLKVLDFNQFVLDSQALLEERILDSRFATESSEALLNQLVALHPSLSSECQSILVSGQMLASELEQMGKLSASKEMIELLDIVFPKHTPYIFESDLN
jgi:predicted acetyltransferase